MPNIGVRAVSHRRVAEFGVPGMARKPRREFRGAACHIKNRGNDRSWIFPHAKTRAACPTALFQACERSSWLRPAFVIMNAMRRNQPIGKSPSLRG